ncbi:hypothetical protein [Paenibacillus sp. y28]|uniref:hypothetical protein n=1 Tax=Paenibacillus sp. y28 TaxID=3129110 RepID=UPI0030172D0D
MSGMAKVELDVRTILNQMGVSVDKWLAESNTTPKKVPQYDSTISAISSHGKFVYTEASDSRAIGRTMRR